MSSAAARRHRSAASPTSWAPKRLSKAALTSYALSRRGELAPHGVGVSVAHPGPIREAGMWADTTSITRRG